jgi:hypothetical protein
VAAWHPSNSPKHPVTEQLLPFSRYEKALRLIGVEHEQAISNLFSTIETCNLSIKDFG